MNFANINKDLNLSVFPWLGIETGGVSLSNREGFGEKPFLQGVSGCSGLSRKAL